MGRLGVTEILVILAVVLLLFGGKKIPELMKGLGSGIKEFKNAAKDDQPADKKEIKKKLKNKFSLNFNGKKIPNSRRNCLGFGILFYTIILKLFFCKIQYN